MALQIAAMPTAGTSLQDGAGGRSSHFSEDATGNHQNRVGKMLLQRTCPLGEVSGQRSRDLGSPQGVRSGTPTSEGQ